MNPGMLHGLIGGAIGAAGGIVGTWFSIRNTNGPKERAFAIRMAALMLCGILLFLALLFASPEPHRWLLWGPYVVLLVLGIRHSNKRQAQIRKAELQDNRQ